MENNRNLTDIQLQKKIESLGTLEGGIVFGHEDAWDKLQSRLEQKPDRKIIPFYKWAAAAILLLSLGIAVNYQLQTKDNTLVQHSITQLPVNIPANTSTNEQMPAPANQPTENATIKPTAVVERPSVLKNEAEIITVKSNPIEVQQLPDNNLPVAVEIPSTPEVIAPEPAQQTAMKVVHINELDKNVFNGVLKNITYHPEFAIRTMNVVHINEVLKEENDEKIYHLGSRRTFGNFVFLRPQNSLYKEAYTDGGVSIKNLFKININTQN